MKAVWFNQLDFGSLCRSTQLELARSFSKMGHRLRIVARYRESRPSLARVSPRPLLLKRHLPDPAGGAFFQLQALFLAASEVFKGVDLVMVDHYGVPIMFPFNLLSKAGLIRTKFVVNILSAPVDMLGARYSLSLRRYNLSVRWAKASYDGIIVITDLYRRDISSRFRISPDKIGVCTSGVPADLFDPRKVDTARANAIKSHLGLGDKLVIMYHGVLSANRGLLEAVRALRLLLAEGDKRTVLVFLGRGPAAAQIASLAEAEGVGGSVRLIDAVPYEEVPEYLSICDAGILPFPQIKWWEMSSPLKLMEYLAMEKPVILTDVPAHRAVTGYAACAFYIPDNSPANIAQAIRKLAENRAILHRLGKQGRNIVLENFTWDRQAKNVLDYTAHLHRRKGE